MNFKTKGDATYVVCPYPNSVVLFFDYPNANALGQFPPFFNNLIASYGQFNIPTNYSQSIMPLLLQNPSTKAV